MHLLAALPRVSLFRGALATWRGRRRLLYVALSIPLLVLLGEVVRVLFVGNTHTVHPGRVYRSAQLSGGDLGDYVRKHGIRTIVNLRGCNAPIDWYKNECLLSHQLNLSQEDVTLSANRLPSISELRRLIEVLDRSQYPLVLHCKQGADRTGLASALYLMMFTDTDYAIARKQCGPRYAHLPLLSTVAMDRFFDMYEAWLDVRGVGHSKSHIRKWALTDYRPEPAPAALSLVKPVAVLPMNQPITVMVRARNLSTAPWQFKAGTASAIYMRCLAWHEGHQVLMERGGFRDVVVPPGESIDIPMPITGFGVAGTYRFNIDLIDRSTCFSQLGSEPLIFEIEVQDHQGR